MPCPSESTVFSLMNLLAHSIVMNTPKPQGDTSVFQFCFPFIANCRSPRLALNSKSILIFMLCIHQHLFPPSPIQYGPASQFSVQCCLQFLGFACQAAEWQQCVIYRCEYERIRKPHSWAEDVSLPMNVADDRKTSFKQRCTWRWGKCLEV